MFFCSFAAGYSTLWDIIYSNETNAYLKWNLSDSLWDELWYLKFIKSLGAWILIFTNFIPISLLVTFEMVKFV